MKNEHCIKLENMMHSAPFIQLTGLRASITEREAVMTLPVQEKLFHAAGAMHGALYFLALDNATFFAVNSIVEDVYVLTVDFNISLTKPIKSGIVTAKGKVIDQIKSLYIAEATLYNSENEVAGKGTGKFVRSKIKLTPELGYKL